MNAAAKPISAIDSPNPNTRTQGCSREAPATASTLSSDIETSATTICHAAWATVFWVTHANFPGQLYLGGLVLGVLAVQGFILALVGEYLGRIQRDVEGRPLYTIEQELG